MPLTKLTSIKIKYKWKQVEKNAFNEIKRILAYNNLLSYTDFNEIFKIHTDASAFQLGTVISQKGKPIAFYCRKLSDTKQRYTATEREIPSIIQTLKEFRTILLGQKLRIYTDHKNLPCNFLNTDRVLRWRLTLE